MGHACRLLGILLALLPAAVDAAEPPPSWREALTHLQVGRLVRTRGANVLALELAPEHQAGLDAHVGLSGTAATVTHLPGPAGDWHVRVANPLPRPLLVPGGEILLTPQGPSRMTDRAVWIPAGGATFVPVVQVSAPVPEGPYVHRGELLTPVERTLDDLDALRARIRFRNRAFDVSAFRADDAGAAYQQPEFRERVGTYEKLLSGLADGKRVVGVLVIGESGPHFAHLELDASRFRVLWPVLIRGIALDAMLVEDAGLAARPSVVTEVIERAQVLRAMLEEEPLTRTNFGRGQEHLWAEDGRDEIWRGLEVEDRLVSLTLLRRPTDPDPTPRPRGGTVPPLPTGPGPGGTGGPETPTQPGMVELERRGPRTLLEERLRERRRAR